MPSPLRLFVGCLALVVATGAVTAAERGRATLVEGDAAAVLQAVRKPGARAVLVNVWATWCDPCREEMPEIVRFYRENRQRGLRLVLVSADDPDERAKAAAFLSSQGIDFPTFLKTGDDMAFIEALDPKWSGALPVSILYDGKGQKRHLWPGTVTRDALTEQLGRVLGGAAAPPPATRAGSPDKQEPRRRP